MAKAGLPCSIAAYESSQTLLSDIQTGRHFDLLLLDVLMGELDGMALAAVLKKYPDTPNVVFISTDREMAMQGYRVDAKRYLPKPLDRNCFAKLCSTAMKRPGGSSRAETS